MSPGSRVLLVTGKGGVGKTTVAAATAVHAARRGLKVLVVSTDPAHSLADAFDVRVAAVPTEVETGLYALQVDPHAVLERDWQRLQHRLTRLLDDLGLDDAAAQGLAALPAAAELLALGEVRDQARAGTWDVVVVDCAPTAETLRLLALPEALTGYLERALPPGRRVARALASGAAALSSGRGASHHGDPLLDELRRLADELADLRGLLAAPTTGIRLVLTAERVVLAETRRTVAHLGLLGFGVEAVVVNRLVPGGLVDGVRDPWRTARAEREAQALDDARGSFDAVAVLTLPEDRSEPVGADALSEVGTRLYGVDGSTHDPLVPVRLPPVSRVERAAGVGADAGDWVLVMALPHADLRDLDLRRRGDDLELSLGTVHRVLPLPSLLRRCDVVGARLRDGELRVVFRPDPGLWPEASA